MRGGKEYQANLTLEGAPETVPREEISITAASPLAGTTVLNLSPAVAEELAYTGSRSGVIVSAVAPASPAADIGLRRGDVIVDLNGEPIETTKQLLAASTERAGVWEMTIERDGRLRRTRFNG